MSLIAPAAARGQKARIHVRRPSERRSQSRSATRALDVLEYFGEQRRPLRAVEISRVLEMHPSTTNQLLKTMVDSAHLVFDARSKTYLPSPRLAEFSAWIIETYGAGGRLKDLIRDVQAQTGVVVTVTTPNDLFMQIIDLATPPDQTSERGLQISLFGSAIGSAYLSMLDDGEVLRLADRARIPKAESPEDFLDRMKEASETIGDASSDLDAVGAPDRYSDPAGRLVRALAQLSVDLDATASDLGRPELLPNLVTGAQGINFESWDDANAALADLQQLGIEVDLIGRH